jgi:hypothetical protein
MAPCRSQLLSTFRRTLLSSSTQWSDLRRYSELAYGTGIFVLRQCADKNLRLRPEDHWASFRLANFNSKSLQGPATHPDTGCALPTARMPYSATWRCMALVTTVVSDERIASIIRLERINELVTTLLSTRNWGTLWGNSSYKSHAASHSRRRYPS